MVPAIAKVIQLDPKWDARVRINNLTHEQILARTKNGKSTAKENRTLSSNESKLSNMIEPQVMTAKVWKLEDCTDLRVHLMKMSHEDIQAYTKNFVQPVREIVSQPEKRVLRPRTNLKRYAEDVEDESSSTGEPKKKKVQATRKQQTIEETLRISPIIFDDPNVDIIVEKSPRTAKAQFETRINKIKKLAKLQSAPTLSKVTLHRRRSIKTPSPEAIAYEKLSKDLTEKKVIQKTGKGRKLYSDPSLSMDSEESDEIDQGKIKVRKVAEKKRTVKVGLSRIAKTKKI